MDMVLPPDEFRLNDAADFLPAGEGDAALNSLWGGNNKLAGVAETDEMRSFLRDIWVDTVSGRALAFYSIPKVKLDLTAEEEAEAAVRREAMYQRAIRA